MLCCWKEAQHSSLNDLGFLINCSGGKGFYIFERLAWRTCSCEYTVSVITRVYLYHCFVAQISKNAWAIREGEQRTKKIGTAKRWQGNSSEEVKGTYESQITTEI